MVGVFDVCTFKNRLKRGDGVFHYFLKLGFKAVILGWYAVKTVFSLRILVVLLLPVEAGQTKFQRVRASRPAQRTLVGPNGKSFTFFVGIILSYHCPCR